MYFAIYSFFFFFNDTAPTEIYPLSLHDALPISIRVFAGDRAADDLDDLVGLAQFLVAGAGPLHQVRHGIQPQAVRSEEHTSELQSRLHLVCRLLLEKKKRPKYP